MALSKEVIKAWVKTANSYGLYTGKDLERRRQTISRILGRLTPIDYQENIENYKSNVRAGADKWIK